MADAFRLLHRKAAVFRLHRRICTTSRAFASELGESQSRTASKRSAKKWLQVAVQLCESSRKQLLRLQQSPDIAEELYDAISIAQGIPKRNQGKKRQINYVARLLRELDPEEQRKVEAVAHGLPIGADVAAQQNAINLSDSWFRALLADDEAVISELNALPPEWGDLQQIRQLTRRCQQLRAQQSVGKADSTDLNQTSEVWPAQLKHEKQLRGALRILAGQYLEKQKGGSHLDDDRVSDSEAWDTERQ